jgi:hypothetical protein
MRRWSQIAAVVIASATLHAISPSSAAQFRSSSQVTDADGRRYGPYEGVRRRPPYEPHYYARPYHYRPYPYGVPYPFVLGFGPWW